MKYNKNNNNNNKKVLKYGEQDVAFVNLVWVIHEVTLIQYKHMYLLVNFQKTVENYVVPTYLLFKYIIQYPAQQKNNYLYTFLQDLTESIIQWSLAECKVSFMPK